MQKSNRRFGSKIKILHYRVKTQKYTKTRFFGEEIGPLTPRSAPLPSRGCAGPLSLSLSLSLYLSMGPCSACWRILGGSCGAFVSRRLLACLAWWLWTGPLGQPHRASHSPQSHPHWRIKPGRLLRLLRIWLRKGHQDTFFDQVGYFFACVLNSYHVRGG